MENRIIEITKDGDDYIVQLDMIKLTKLWEKMKYPHKEIPRFLKAYLNHKDYPASPPLAEVMEIDLTKRSAIGDLMRGIKDTAIDKTIAEEIMEGIEDDIIPLENIKANFKFDLLAGSITGEGKTHMGTTVAEPSELGESDEDEFKPTIIRQEKPNPPVNNGRIIRNMASDIVIGYQPSTREPGSGPINKGLLNKLKTRTKEQYIPETVKEQYFAKAINHDLIPEIDAYTRANIKVPDISKKRLERLNTAQSVLTFVRELEAYIKTGATKGIVVSTVAEANAMDFLTIRFKLSEEEISNLTFDELRWLYAMKIARNMEEVVPSVARLEVLEALKKAGSRGKYATWNVSYLAPNNVDRLSSFLAELDQPMISLFGDKDVDPFTMKIFTDGVKIVDKSGVEKKIRIIGSNQEHDDIRAYVKQFSDNKWRLMKNVLNVHAEEMDDHVQTAINKGHLQKQKEQIERAYKSEERDKEAKEKEKKRVNQLRSEKREPICDICGGKHYAFDRDATSLTCEKHKSDDLKDPKNKELKELVEKKMKERKSFIEKKKKEAAGRQHK